MQRENNPHFVTPPLSPNWLPPLSPLHPQPSSRRPKRSSTRHGTGSRRPPPDSPFPPAYVTPQPHMPPPLVPPEDFQRYQPPPEALVHPGSKHPTVDGQPQQQPGTLHSGEHLRPQQPQHHLGRHHHGQQGHPQHRPSSVRLPGSRKTRPVAWLIAAFCTLFWIIVIVGGLAILIIYLLFRPRLPKFDISSATLNAAYLDMGYLLNADLAILGNFTNPNKKVNVDFSYVVIDLYHDREFIATRYVEPFTAMKRHSRFENIQMMTSQVPLTSRHSQELQRQIDNGRVMFDVKGYFRARSNLGGFLRYSYWLYGHCTITVTSPPAGVFWPSNRPQAFLDFLCTFVGRMEVLPRWLIYIPEDSGS